MLKALKMKKNQRNAREPKKNPFDLLPDEMVVHVLCFVPVDSLLDCRLVCRRWRVFIDSRVYQEKAAQENEFVNNGRGFYSFSQIDSNTVRKLNLPWYVFYTVCKHDPFNRNLVKNHCGQNEFEHWNVLRSHYSNARNDWIIEKPPAGTSVLPNDPDFDGNNSCFASTYIKCFKLQTIMFKNYGLTKNVMKFLQPEILVSEWYSGRFDCGCKYVFKATIHDYNNELLEQHDYYDVLRQWEADRWIKTSHSFKNQGNATYLTLFHSGVDTQFWAGHYGTKISGSVVKVLLPIILKSSE